MQSLMLGEHLLGAQATAWAVATKARLGMIDEARMALAAILPARAASVEVRNANALIALISGDPTVALEQLREVAECQVPVIYDSVRVESNLLLAQAHHSLGNEVASYSAIETALALAERDRMIFPFAMAGVRELLERHPRQTTAHTALLLEILDLIGGSSPRPAPAEVPLNELSGRELRVLGFLPTNLSRPDIARELRVSVNTVNTHMRNIFLKLGAGNRTEAVAIARQLRLLAH
jgi:LuxR family transcriptional regulator, maltose regulon positive regulatory protein